MEHDPAGPDVSAVIDGFSRELLWRHVADFALENARTGLLAESTFGLCDSEIDQLDLTLLTDEYILRAHIAMHDAARNSTDAQLVRRV
jgi:hypothetical protein